jgi:DUF4097 and DUF4098 domain-containing protein YvlB
MRKTLVAALSMVALAAPAGAQTAGDDFSWSGRVPAGQWLYIKNINGDVTVDRASGNDVEVVATKRARRDGDPGRVRIEASAVSGGQLICAIWEPTTTCDERGYHNENRGRNNDRNTGNVEVDFIVRLPAGVRANVSSVNGDVRVMGATAQVVAQTVNGDVDASTSMGPVRANTVNGDITVRMDALQGEEDLEFETVNGSIEAHLPANFQGDVELQTVNGSLTTDFPITVQGRFNPRHMRATIGNGGRSLKLSTVNGSIRLGKRP